MLENVDLTKKVPKQEWQTRKLALQDRLYNAAKACWDSNTPVCVIFEGWDAGGKGGNIRRLVEALDPRGYRVLPIAAPKGEERTHNYLWRFWNRIPAKGEIAPRSDAYDCRPIRPIQADRA